VRKHLGQRIRQAPNGAWCCHVDPAMLDNARQYASSYKAWERAREECEDRTTHPDRWARGTKKAADVKYQDSRPGASALEARGDRTTQGTPRHAGTQSRIRSTHGSSKNNILVCIVDHGYSRIQRTRRAVSLDYPPFQLVFSFRLFF
jgi:hypothetical protein